MRKRKSGGGSINLNNYSFIYDPVSHKHIHINSIRYKEILKSYIKILNNCKLFKK